MANQIKLTAVITPANTAVEASTDSGATYRAVAMSTVGSQQEGILTNVTAGTYAIGAVKLRAVSAPAVIVSNTTALTVVPTSAGLTVNITTPGNSIVAGTSNGGGVGNGWVHQMQQLLPATGYHVNNAVGVISQGGWGIANLEAHAADVDATLATAAGAVNVLIVMEGTNSMASMTGQAYLDRLNAYCDARRTAGWNKIIQVTIPPQVSAQSAFNADAQSVNNLIRTSNPHRDDVMDLSLNLKTGNFSPPSADTPAWYPDGLHPSVLTETIMGRMGYDAVNFVVSGVAKPDPANYPPGQVLPGQDVIWTSLTHAVTGTGADANSVWQTAGLGQYDGSARSQQSYTTAAGLVCFGEMTMGSSAPGFWGPTANFGSTGFGWFDQGIYFAGGSARIWSSGGVADPGVVVSQGDRLRYEVYADKVLFYRNGSLFYTLTKAVGFPVFMAYIVAGSSTLTRETGVLTAKTT